MVYDGHMTDEAFKNTVEARLASFFEHQCKLAATSEARQMIERLQQLVLRAGKRSRPRLLKLTYEAYGGKDSEILVDIALALELQHQFLLVHDDIMDNDTVRYDGPNMLGYYREDFPAGQTDIANSMALMAGNLLFTFACQAILEHSSLSAEQKIAVLKIIQETNIAVHAGQQLDIVNVLTLNPEITEDKLLQTDYLKTSIYSVRQPMQVAAELLALPTDERQKIDTFARFFGILYQLVDDYSDYFVNGSSFETHPKYRDYKQGKITYPLLVALKTADSTDVALLKNNAADKDLTVETLQHVVQILIDCGAQAASKKQIEAYHEQALKSLNLLSIDKESSAGFITMLDSFQI